MKKFTSHGTVFHRQVMVDLVVAIRCLKVLDMFLSMKFNDSGPLEGQQLFQVNKNKILFGNLNKPTEQQLESSILQKISSIPRHPPGVQAEETYFLKSILTGLVHE